MAAERKKSDAVSNGVIGVVYDNTNWQVAWACA